jgi:PKD repeat protein
VFAAADESQRKACPRRSSVLARGGVRRLGPAAPIAVTVLMLIAGTALAAKPVVTASFVFQPATPLVGGTVTFTSTSSVNKPDISIARHEWDLNGDGTFETNSGVSRTVARSYGSAGTVDVGLRVTDTRGKTAVQRRSIRISSVPPPTPVNQPPSASFVFYPDEPVAGQRVTLVSTSSDPDGPLAADRQRWDLNGDGKFGDAVGTVVGASFPTAGSHVVGLRVIDTDGAAASTRQEITVVDPVSAQGGSGGGGTQGAGPFVRSYGLMSPFPVVRMIGRLTTVGVKINRLSVSGPRNVRIVVRCKGRSCPFRRKKLVPSSATRKRTALVRVRGLERSLRAGVVLRIFVRSGDAIGKYTRFRIRRAKPPTRADRCTIPGVSRPVRCPAS